MHETHIVFENLSNIDGDMLQKPWGLNFGEDGKNIMFLQLESLFKYFIMILRKFFFETSINLKKYKTYYFTNFTRLLFSIFC